MNQNILKPKSASRRWKLRRKSLNRQPLPCVREPFVPHENDGKSKRLPAFKHPPFDVTTFAKKAHEGTAVVAHEFHASRSKKGTLGQSPLNRNPRTVKQRERDALAAK